MKYIVASTPEELLEGIVSYIREFSGRWEALQVSSTLEYDTDKNTWSIKIRVVKLPTLDELTPAVAEKLPKVDPTGVSEKTVELTFDVPDSDQLFVEKGDVVEKLKQAGLLRSYLVHGKVVKAYSLPSAVDKYLDSAIHDGYNWFVGRAVFASRRDAFFTLLHQVIYSRMPYEIRASVSPAGPDYVTDLLSHLFPVENSPTTDSEKPDDIFVGDLDINPLVEKKATTDELSELFPNAIFTDTGVMDLSDVVNIPSDDSDFVKVSSAHRHPVAIALEKTFPFIRRADFNPDTNVAELIIDDYTKVLWKIDYDDETKEVNGMDGLVRAMSQTVKAKVTPFGEKETPRWKLVEQDGTFIFQPVE